MKISSSELRSLVRTSILDEVSEFGRVGNLEMDFRCEWIDRVPQNLTKLFNTVGGNVEEILGDIFPALKLGPKAAKDASLFTTLLGELGYVMTEVWRAQGGPCVGFYFFNHFPDSWTFLGLFVIISVAMGDPTPHRNPIR